MNIFIIGGNFIGKFAEAMLLTLQSAIEKQYPNTQFLLSPTDNTHHIKNAESMDLYLLIKTKVTEL